MMFIGIDISKEKIDLSWLRDQLTNKIKTKVFKNKHQDFEKIEKWLLNTTKSVASELVITLEPTGVYHEALMYFLHEQGFNMMPINPQPGLNEIRGIQVFPTLAKIESSIDMVQVFRHSSALYGIAEDAIKVGAKVLWAQIGVFDERAARLAEDAGLKVVMNRCPKIELFRPFWKPKLNLGV